MPGAVDDPHDFQRVRKDAIEDEIVANRTIAQAGPKIRPGRAHVRMFGQVKARDVDPVEDSVGRVGVVLGDGAPDVDQVFFGEEGPGQA